jgi:DNA replication protein DnaC
MYGCPLGVLEVLGKRGRGKSHIAIALRVAACQKYLSMKYFTAAALDHELMDARNDFFGCSWKRRGMDDTGLEPVTPTMSR